MGLKEQYLWAATMSKTGSTLSALCTRQQSATTIPKNNKIARTPYFGLKSKRGLNGPNYFLISKKGADWVLESSENLVGKNIPTFKKNGNRKGPLNVRPNSEAVLKCFCKSSFNFL